ncbi:LytR/AlgR family response regulator transcription factor [Sphingobacterium suaedae]|uniref:LytR/AlgR family response regulator transcription factor n=1 Tax=Sphingobacterium suaedae TaxID=1686402 RepID=A0ABW5KPM0_9SPHI
MEDMTKTVVIADRYIEAREAIRRYVHGVMGFRVIRECSNRLETIRSVSLLTPDVLFVEEGLYRMYKGEILSKGVCHPLTVILADKDACIERVFKKDVFDYLRKPYTQEDVERTLHRISYAVQREIPSERPNTASSAIFVVDGIRFKKIAIGDVMHVKAARDYSIIYTDVGEYVSSHGIGYIAERLNAGFFVRVHRSFIVNLAYVDELHREGGRMILVLKNGHEVTVSRRYVDTMKRLIL